MDEQYQLKAVIENDLPIQLFSELINKNIQEIFESYFERTDRRDYIIQYLASMFMCFSIPIHMDMIFECLWKTESFDIQNMPRKFIERLIISYIINSKAKNKYSTIRYLFDMLPDKEKNEISDRELLDMINKTENPEHSWAIVPTIRQLQLKTNNDLKVNRNFYLSLDDYLDTHYQLLKEEFFHPLRTIIRETSNKMPQHKHFCNTYTDVYVETVYKSVTGTTYTMQVNPCLINNRKLTFGSLVIISNNDFIDFSIGIITNRNKTDFENGLIGVTFKEELDNKFVFESFTLIEARAFFDCYKNILDSIFITKILSTYWNMPLLNKLYQPITSIEPSRIPHYLSGVKLDISCIMKPTPNQAHSQTVVYVNNINWPNPNEVLMESKQYEAIMFILKNNISIVQGPPGTGKTFVGVKLVEILLNNFDELKYSTNRVPIVIVTQTNNALDQLLENISRSRTVHNNKLVRIGGRSNSLELKPYNLKEIRKSKHSFPGSSSIDLKLKEYKRDLTKLSKITNKIANIIKFSKSYLLNGKSIFDELSASECNLFSDNSNYGILQTINFFDPANPTRDMILQLIKSNSFDNEMELDIHANFKRKRDNSVSVGSEIEEVEDFENLISEQIRNEVDLDTVESDETEEVYKLDKSVLNEFISNETLVKFLQTATSSKNLKKHGENQIKKFKHFLFTLFNIKVLDLQSKFVCNCKNPKSVCESRKDCPLTLAFDKHKKNAKREYRLFKVVYNKNNYDDFASKARMTKDSVLKLNLDIELNLDLDHSVFCHVCKKMIYSTDQITNIYTYINGFNQFIKTKSNEFEQKLDEYSKVLQKYLELLRVANIHILKNAQIIGMTTSCAGRMNREIKDLGISTLIIEEAAHVLESHIISAITPSVQHVVLIGDHIQMRPLVTVNHLVTQNHMDISMFERLVNNGFPKIVLNCQYRLNTSLSWIYKHFYDEKIMDHISVSRPVRLNGVSRNIVFMNHSHQESSCSDSFSKMNDFEVKYITKFCLYLKKNEIKNITIITMYLGQKKAFQKALTKALILDDGQEENEGSLIELATVDDYQGKENDIIILSLVNSKKIGFLKEKTRMCVSLTRARIGLFVIGNLEFLKDQAPNDWGKLIDEAKERNLYDIGIPLTCSVHPQNNVVASEHEHFDERFDGGCSIKCEKVLECGHKCPKRCHVNPDHSNVKCSEKCNKNTTCEFNNNLQNFNGVIHICQQVCGHVGDCNICSTEVEKVISECGHRISWPCSKEPNKTNCTSPCSKFLPKCDHPCVKQCKEICQPCAFPIEIRSSCPHGSLVNMDCGEIDQTWKYPSKCVEKCQVTLNCGHTCSGNCGDCHLGNLHLPCTYQCGRLLYCGHGCQGLCTELCPPCKLKCQNLCSHVSCDKLCSEPCIKCRIECDFECPHIKCDAICSNANHKEPCNEVCEKSPPDCKFPEAHKCAGYCGEPCPPCFECNMDVIPAYKQAKESKDDGIQDNDDILDLVLDSGYEQPLKFVKLECGHVFESNEITNYVLSNINSQSELEYPRCYATNTFDLRCNHPIINCIRFRNILKEMTNNLERIKTRAHGSNAGEHFDKLKKQLQTHLGSNQPINNHLQKYFSQKLDINSQIMLKNVSHSYYILLKLESKISDTFRNSNIDYFQHLEYIRKDLSNYILNRVFGKNILITSQALTELNNEIRRVQYWFFYYKILQKRDKLECDEDLTNLNLIQQNLALKLDLEKMKFIEVCFTNINKNLKSLKIEFSTKIEILKAMNLRKGHWFMCKNKHIYCITECGGAMQSMICPESGCGQMIGGSNHKLNEGNELARHFDNAPYAAYSNEAYEEQIATIDLNDEFAVWEENFYEELNNIGFE